VLSDEEANFPLDLHLFLDQMGISSFSVLSLPVPVVVLGTA
jgi:hypothetical protein